MKQIQFLLQLPILLTILTVVLTFSVHTFTWVKIGDELIASRIRHNDIAITEIHALTNYCAGCHQAGRSGIDFDNETLTLETMRGDPAIWKHVVGRLRRNEMPPQGYPQPSALERELLIAWIEQEVIHERYAAPNARFMARRLLRNEYLNSVRDLLGVRLPVEVELPKDDIGWRRCDEMPTGAEFREAYRVAADKIVDQAIVAERARTQFATGQQDTQGMGFDDGRLFVPACACLPSADSARDMITRFICRAYRRPAESSEIERVTGIFEKVESEGESFEHGMKAALVELLTSPQFLYRTEDRNAESDPHALASRLSYFLWRSTPDDELLALAEQGELADCLEMQVRRMLKDPRSKAFAKDFTDSWLALGKIELILERDPKLLKAMREETENFTAHIVHENRSVLEFLDSDYTFLNERLASHYGITGVQGEHMRRVEIDGIQRGGLVSHASVLSATSLSYNTRPVNRGKWVLENILGAPPIKPPPGILDAFKETARGKTSPGSLRAQLELHRTNPSCAECHAKLDAIGLVLENFDAMGAWRTEFKDHPIDGIGTLPDGKVLRSPADLRAYLLTQREAFVRGLSEKLLQFALARKLDDRDRASLAAIPEAAAAAEYRFGRVISEVVQSSAFREGWR